MCVVHDEMVLPGECGGCQQDHDDHHHHDHGHHDDVHDEVALLVEFGDYQQDGQDCFDETADEVHKSHDGMRQCVISVEEFISSKANIRRKLKRDMIEHSLLTISVH